jgi:hypothetical protein
MTRLASFPIASLALGVSLVLAPPSHAQTQYAVVELAGLPGSALMTDLGTLPGRTDSSANAINDRGETAGTSYGILLGSNYGDRAIMWIPKKGR